MVFSLRSHVRQNVSCYTDSHGLATAATDVSKDLLMANRFSMLFGWLALLGCLAVPTLSLAQVKPALQPQPWWPVVPHQEILEVTAVVHAAAKSLADRSRLVKLAEVMS